ncbi:MAG: DUF4153 domain-containing protein [Deltaproteobacteria bacterium]|nr:DUF4153 domain-containing protein [Deltaproteobacteria bacterium]
MKFKMLSVRELTNRTRETVSRFSLLSFFLCVGAVNHLYMDIYHEDTLKYASRNIFMSLLVLLPVLYSIRLLYESMWIGKRAKSVVDGVFVIAAGFYFYCLPDQPLIPLYWSRFAVFFISSVLLCFVCVKKGAGDDDYYWHFHAALFVRLVITWLYTLVIIAGTSVALGAIDILFKTDLFRHDETRILIVTLWIFAPIFFLSGVPNSRSSEEVAGHGPGWLKNIGVYVMVPLTTVYLGILYAYGGKILFQWQLPEGTVSYLVLSFAAFGIVSLLIIFPFQKDENAKWCQWFSRYFYFFQIPLLFLLFVAIFERVLAYGITFRRYYVLALAIWLLFITVFMIIRKSRNLIVIPLSLLVIAMLSILGPWSSFNVSYMNQKDRLLKLLDTNNLIQNGKLVLAKEPLPFKDKTDISSIVMYLHDYGKLQTLASLTTSRKAITPESFTEELGFEYVKSYNYERNSFYYHCGNQSLVLPIEGYQLFARFRENFDARSNKISRVEKGDLLIEFFPETAMFQFSDDESHKSRIELQQIAAYFKAAKTSNNGDCCSYLYQDGFFDITCLFGNLSGWEDQNGTHFYAVDVDLLVKKR